MSDVLSFHEIHRPFEGLTRSRTKAFQVCNSAGSTVGQVRWNHGLKGYAFYPVKGAAYNRTMLRELVEFMHGIGFRIRARVPSAAS